MLIRYSFHVRLISAMIIVISTSALPPLSQHYQDVEQHPASSAVGVFRIVDENSCECVGLEEPCPVPVTRLKEFPCPTSQIYCCHRETLLTLDDLINRTRSKQKDVSSSTKKPSDTEMEPNTTTETSVSATSVTSNARVTSDINEMINNTSQTSLPSDHLAGGKPGEGEVIVPASSNDLPDGVRQGDLLTSTYKPEADSDVIENQLSESIGTSTVEETVRRPKMVACSCTTSESCLATWALIGDLPKVNIRTSLRCEGPNEVTCCFGRVMPPGGQKAQDSERKRPDAVKWRPLASMWDSVQSWFNG